MKPKILVIHSSFLEMLEPYASELSKQGFEVIADPDFARSPPDDILSQYLPGVHILLTGGSGLKEKHMALADQLKVVSVMASGYDSINLPLLTARGIVVTNTPIQEGATPVAELSIAMMYALAREIPRYDRILKSGQYERGFGRMVSGRTLGIIGTGTIGKETAKLARGLNMEVLAYSRTEDAGFAEEWSIRYVSLDELLRQSDYVSLHMRLGEATKEVIGDRELRLMKPTAFLINTARMGLVNREALADSLIHKRIAGSALDFGGESKENERLFQMDNVIVTPHIGNRVMETYRLVVECGIQNAIDVFEGRRPPYVVNPEVYADR